MQPYWMKATDVIGYAADADVWCPPCAAEAYPGIERQGGAMVVGIDPTIHDHEGNEVHPIFVSDELAPGEYCGRCFEPLL